MITTGQIAPRTMEALSRLADALDTTLDDLLLRAPATWFEPLGEEQGRLVELSGTDCLNMLTAEEIGRVAMTTEHGPVVFPVTYAFVAGRPVFRTTTASPLARLDGEPVAFQIDGADRARREGWSVLVTGTGRVAVGDEVSALHEAGPAPWPGGLRDVYVVVEPAQVTGRQIVYAPRGSATAPAR